MKDILIGISTDFFYLPCGVGQGEMSASILLADRRGRNGKEIIIDKIIKNDKIKS